MLNHLIPNKYGAPDLTIITHAHGEIDSGSGFIFQTDESNVPISTAFHRLDCCRQSPQATLAFSNLGTDQICRVSCGSSPCEEYKLHSISSKGVCRLLHLHVCHMVTACMIRLLV